MRPSVSTPSTSKIAALTPKPRPCASSSSSGGKLSAGSCGAGRAASDDLRPHQVVAVQRADQRAAVVDHQHAGDAVLLHHLGRLDRERDRRARASGPGCITSRAVSARRSAPRLDQPAQVAVGEDAERPGRRRRRRRWRPGPCRVISRSMSLKPASGADAAAPRRRSASGRARASAACGPSAPPGCERAKSSALEAARVEQRHGERVAQRHLRRGAGGRRQVERAGLLVDARCRARCRHGAPSVESARPVIAISVHAEPLDAGRIAASSSLSPLLEMASTRSPGVTMPRSPWLASAGCTNIAGVPVEASVAAILRPTWPLLPMPITTTRPRHFEDRAHRLARSSRPVAPSARAARRPRCRRSSRRAAARVRRRRAAWLTRAEC